jgi:magnesium-transporting ATPase (P-type)
MCPAQLLLSMPNGTEWILVLVTISFLLAFLGFWIYTIVDVAKSNFADDTTKIVWLLVVLITGIIGAVIYWIFGRPHRILAVEI